MVRHRSALKRTPLSAPLNTPIFFCFFTARELAFLQLLDRALPINFFSYYSRYLFIKFLFFHLFREYIIGERARVHVAARRENDKKKPDERFCRNLPQIVQVFLHFLFALT